MGMILYDLNKDIIKEELYFNKQEFKRQQRPMISRSVRGNGRRKRIRRNMVLQIGKKIPQLVIILFSCNLECSCSGRKSVSTELFYTLDFFF